MGILFRIILVVTIFLSFNFLYAQKTTVTGKVTDSETGAPLSFVNVYFEGTSSGTFTDDFGKYNLETNTPSDSISFSFFGYKDKKMPVRKGISQEINVSLAPAVTTLKTIVITNREDPAVSVIRKSIKNKDKYDKRNLHAYEYESFTQIIAGFDKIPGSLRERKIGKEITALLDSLKKEGEDASLPFFASEAVSRFYYRGDPEKTTEFMLGTRVSGVFLEDGSVVSQLIGSSFQNYNFYKNWLSIVDKDFISPIADGALGFYDYKMLDTIKRFNSLPEYEIIITPKREQDLAFQGKIWIQDSTFAITRIKVEVGKGANINYIGGIKIEQELIPTTTGPWLPEYTDVTIRFIGLSEKWAGLEANYKSFNSDFIVNQPRPLKFYETPITVEEDASEKNEQFWKEKRQEPLTEEEQRKFALIDSVKNLPTVKTYIEVIDIAINGYFEAGKVDFGPYIYSFAHNDIEGARFRLGFKTNKKFSDKWILSGFGAYGTKDNIFKYGANMTYIASRKHWTTISAGYKFDIDQIAIPEDKLQERNNLFLAFTKWGRLVGPTYNHTYGFDFYRQLTKDFSQRVILRKRIYDPLFAYAYFPALEGGDSLVKETINTSEIILESRLARDEMFVQNDNDRISLGTKWPVFKVRYTLGLKNALNSDIDYQKIDIVISDNFKVGALGRSYFDLNIGRIFSSVPLPLLEVHLGNETPFYTTAGFNLMDYFEFVSDKYITLKYRHYFQGLIFNRIPVIKKLNLRFLTTAGVVYGGMDNANRRINAPFDLRGNQTVQFSSLSDKPYVELGYGIENIFKVLRVDAFHRITYLDRPGVRKFGVKLSLQFSL